MVVVVDVCIARMKGRRVVGRGQPVAVADEVPEPAGLSVLEQGQEKRFVELKGSRKLAHHLTDMLRERM